MSVNTTNIPDDAHCSHQQLLQALKSDKLEEFQEAMSVLTEFDVRIIIKQNRSETVPWMVLDNPPLPCLCAFVAAEQCFNYLLSLGIDFADTDDQSRTLGHFAVAGGSMEILRLIDIHIQGTYNDIFETVDSKGNSCAHFAAKFGRMDALQWLWTKGFDLNNCNENGASPFMWSCSNGQLEMAKFLLEHGADPNGLTYGRWSPLHYAVAQNQPETTKFLLGLSDVEIDLMRNNYTTPLITAIQNNAFECVKLLVEHGCSFKGGIYKRNKFYHFDSHPIRWAISDEHWDIAEYLINDDDAWLTLNDDDISETVKDAIGSETMFNIVCEKLRRHSEGTHLDFASIIDSVLCKCSATEFESLVKIGKIPLDRVRWRDQMTFLHIAVTVNNKEVVKYLVERNADINAVSTDGNTPLSLAILRQRVKIAEYLVKQKSLDVTKTFGAGNENYLDLCLRSTKKLQNVIAALEKKMFV